MHDRLVHLHEQAFFTLQNDFSPFRILFNPRSVKSLAKGFVHAMILQTENSTITTQEIADGQRRA
jgi:uncharacterized lipoprotein YbaY